MKKIEINKDKLKLQKEKISDLVDPKKQKNALGSHIEPTTTVLDHTKILCRA